MTPELVIFDCDGVLIDSEVIACRVEAELLTELGLPMTAEDVNRRFVGRSGAAVSEILEAELGRPLPADFSQTMWSRTRAAFESELRAIPGIAETLDRLALPCCVASSSDPERLEVALGLTGLYARFAPHVFSTTMVARGKPAPDLFLYAAAQRGARPAHCIVVEDSAPGVQAGAAAGMRVLGFVGGSHCRPGHADRLARAGASAVFDDIRELPALAACEA